MTILFWLLGAALVFAIAAVAVGKVTASLAASPTRAVYDVQQSVDFVAEALPDELTARLSYDDVHTILHLYHDHLHAKGLATTAGDPEAERGAVVISTEEAVADVVRRAANRDRTLDPDDVEAVIEAQLAYFDAIGVVGPVVSGPGEADLVDRPEANEGTEGTDGRPA